MFPILLHFAKKHSKQCDLVLPFVGVWCFFLKAFWNFLKAFWRLVCQWHFKADWTAKMAGGCRVGGGWANRFGALHHSVLSNMMAYTRKINWKMVGCVTWECRGKWMKIGKPYNCKSRRFCWELLFSDRCLKKKSTT